MLKVYFHNGTVTFQNVLRHRLIIFLFCRKLVFRSQDFQVFYIFNHLMIYQIRDVMVVLVHETGCIFEYIF